MEALREISDSEALLHVYEQRFKHPECPELSCDLSPPWKADDEILEEFPFDNELTRHFMTDVEVCSAMIGSLFSIGPLVPLYYPIAKYFANLNQADAAYCRWVAVSRDNLFIIRKKRASGCRFSCQDIGETRKCIPIANIQDVMITEPAGTAVCCFIPNVLTNVKLQTAASSSGGLDPQNDSSMATLSGLQDPNRFRKVVMGLKKGVYITKDGVGYDAPAPVMIQRTDSLGAENLTVPGEVAPAVQIMPVGMPSMHADHADPTTAGKMVLLLQQISDTLKSIEAQGAGKQGYNAVQDM